MPDLNGHSGLILAVFIIVSAFVIWPVRIPFLGFIQTALLKTCKALRIIGPQDYTRLSKKRLYFPLSLKTAPPIGVLLLLATTTINGSTIALGVKGDNTVKPYDVLVLFISLAYISIALDGTGAIEAVAFWVSKRGGTSGVRLFTYLYLFFLGVGCIVGNDPLILSGTPFLAYLTNRTGIEPTAWVFSEFMAANVASAVLVSSNPTNILVAGSFQLNYLTGFTKWTVLPSIIPAIANYPILLAMFWNKIPKTLTPVQDNPWDKLRDRPGAAFFSVLMVITVAVLVGTSFVPGHSVDVWMVTAPAGILAFAFDLFSDITRPKVRSEAERRFSVAPETGKVKVDKELLPDANIPEKQEDISPVADQSLSGSSPDLKPSEKEPATLFSFFRWFKGRFPGTTLTITRLPIPLLPFAICEFILVRGLSQRNWISVFAHGFSNACSTPLNTVFFFGFVCAAFLCPLAGTNIGATIILVEILQDPAFQNSPAVTADPKILLAAIYAVAMGSNLGAFSYTFAGSLAGLLWKGLLADKGIHISQLKFAVVNVFPLLVQTTIACAIIYGELYWFS
ncbi:MAG: hypothetical protein GOMPHAMPRED_006516 [Gomphillus americanus]|uniref:Citrate transporter-like domain-containing protein n=1 Tax=Gomphillus americanus TaxID=1940652 RepID=A0A8H3G085_9LECA|nr:MAG: hypothetical protein GOMPHAMPRED_006516 [Gomphillus americanus]